MKRFYKDVTVGQEAERFRVLLDGRPVKTPLKAVLEAEKAELAQAVALEWQAQSQEILPETMPVTKLAATAIDLMPQRRQEAIAEIADFAQTDMLCYQAGAPGELALRQKKLWQPWLDWAATALDAPLRVTTGLEALSQPQSSVDSLRTHVERLDHWRLVGVHAATQLTGSAVLALALQQRAMDAPLAHELALVEELFEVERFGLEEEQARRHARQLSQLQAVGVFLQAL